MMTSVMTLATDPVKKLRHSAQGSRTFAESKQVRIERAKSVEPNSKYNIQDGEDNYPVSPDIAVITSRNDENVEPEKKMRETTMFLTAARRISTPKVNRACTPIEVEDLTEEELDAYYFDEPEAEPNFSKFDVKKYYASMCEKDDLLPSTTFLRQIEKPTCNLSCLLMNEMDVRPIATTLVNNSKITELDLSENDLGSKGMHHIAEALRENVFITHVKLSRVGMDPTGVKYLQECLKCNKTLTHLDLSTNHLNANSAVYIAKLIQENDFIVELVLKENDLDDEAGCKMAKSISSNLTLRHLDLSWNHLRGRGASEVVKAICENVELIDVNLSWNGLGEEGSIAFGKYFMKNHTLRKLDLTNTRINFTHLGHILKGLKLNDTLETVKLTSNPFTTDGAIAILKCLELSSTSVLKNLHLEDTPVDDEFLDAYEELQNIRDIHVYHKEPNKKKITSILREKKLENYDPMLLLFELMRQENMRLIDLFRQFDKDSDNNITKQELKDGFLRFSLELSEDKLESLMNKLDLDENHNIDLHELVYGRRQAAHVRHLASTDTVGRLSESMKHLQKLVEKSRKEKYDALIQNIETKQETKKKPMYRRESAASLSFEITDEGRKTLESIAPINIES
ncbi:leucine-rich repeat-containing protein 74B-like isoform X1 [Mytilus trossulus]|uniref:leucine-rich repeat-containing protein 74B-like isoform X1 n=1 Tax=Mytilus trossulus TaxID=6551 RepID=UPI0030040AE1